MKKLFNQRKRPDGGKNIDWEEEDFIEEEDGFYEEDFQTGDAMYEEEPDAYYAEEAEDYYAREDEECYADEYAEAEESEYYEEEEYYIEEDLEESEEYYADEEEDYYEEEKEVPVWRRTTPKPQDNAGFFMLLWSKFLHMNSMDRIVMSTGVLVLVLALITGAVYVSASMLNRQVASFEKIGTQLDNISMIGEAGLLAVADAELARILAANAVEEVEEEEEGAEYEENEYTKEAQVSVNLTSIQKDLKIKFINNKTNKLIPNVPFKVTVKTPGGASETWEDDDKDGIIYKKGIASGSYSVAMEALEGEKYADYIISTDSKKIEVKEKISYDKVDVSAEIKKESEINAAKEDTKKNENNVESALKDTVTWVESTKKMVDALYTAVPKGNIASPLTSAVKSQFMRLSQYTGSMTGGALEVGGKMTVSLSGLPAGFVAGGAISYSSDNPAVAAVNASTGEVTGISAGTAVITAAVSGTVSSGDAQGAAAVTATCTITVNKGIVGITGITLDKTTLAVAVGGTGTITGTIAPADATDKTIQWTSSDAGIAAVSNGTVTGVKAGQAVITAKAGDKTAVCTVTVGTDATAIKLSHSSAVLPVNGVLELKATVEPANATNQIVSWVTSNAGIVSVDAAGKITAVAKGTADITAKVGTLTAICKVTVSDRAITFNKSTVTVMTEGTDTVTATVSNTTGGTLTAESSDTGKATVSMSDNIITVKGVAAGSATVTVVHKDNGVETKAAFTVNVKNHATKLTDATGKQLYVYTGKDGQNKDVYREAIYADYAAFDTFYLKAEGTYKYTGWQTLNGKLYYYDANGKYVTGEQVIQGAKYTFASDGSLVTGNGQFGIDVSKWNGTIDWNAVKNSGVNYVIIRCGYRGSSAGSLIEDPKFKANIKGATAAGLKVGVYFFTQAVDEVEAVEEASMVLGLIKNYAISYPVFLDVESSGGRADKISSATRTSVIKAFCETIQKSGYTAGVYANKTWLNSKMDASQLSKYKIWLAQYASAPTYSGRYDLWQYKSTGKVSGISGNVDLNLSYLGY